MTEKDLQIQQLKKEIERLKAEIRQLTVELKKLKYKPSDNGY